MRTVRSTRMPGFEVGNNSASSALIDFRRTQPRLSNLVLWILLPVAVVFLSLTGFVFGILP